MATAPDLAPEMLCIVFECLTDEPQSLLSAALVCRKWSQEAIGLLWQKPSPKALATLPPSRRQHYANKIQSLHFDSNEAPERQEQLCRLDFPLLRDLWIEVYRSDKVTLDQYLQPNLEEIYVREGCVTERELGLIRTQCPHLRQFLLASVPNDYIFRLLHQQRHLTGLYTHSHNGNEGDDQVFRAAAAHESLEDLVDNGEIEHDLVRDTMANVPHPFPCLKSVSVSEIASKAAILLLQHATRLQSINFCIKDNDISFRQLIAAVTDPTKAVAVLLRFSQSENLRKEDVLALGSFVALEKLVISSSSRKLESALDEVECLEVFSRLPSLQYLTLYLPCGLHTSHLPIIGRSCRLLKKAQLSGSFNADSLEECLDTVGDYEVLFPELVSLALRHEQDWHDHYLGMDLRDMAEAKDPEKATRTIESIIRPSPNLEDLVLENDSRLARRIVHFWKESSGPVGAC
ncbi:hypothetical protein K431DRAFT_283911 [Polychaeton citri CBS 116435]|uniref:F-box domain-containing protein n=1 Tax=Polychaeton citri CBS 116435 TaxID=1314669 RepID=A0A9P4QB51_9PEZI|nr:hypothetical protein K431DRAFT_283911 [Polychaeton citri CBS 116435]